MKSIFRGIRTYALVTSAFTAVSADPVWAQDAASPITQKDAAAEGDIVVTANRTESLASKTPVTVTAITGEGLRDAGITQPINLVERVPGIEINRSRAGLDITMRGVASSDTTEKGDSSSAFLLDGVNIARAPMKDGSFYDIARVEVLRGPQGTLFGRNSTAGVINVISNRPVFDFQASGDAGYGNLGYRQATAMVNVPLGENFAVRGAVNYEHGDSITIGGALTHPSYKKFRELLSGRLSALFRWDSGEILVRGDYSDIGGSLFNPLDDRKFFQNSPNGPIYVANRLTTRELRTNELTVPWDLYRNNKMWGVGAEITQELGPIDLYYIGSYRRMDRDEQGAFPFVARPFAVRTAEIDTFEQQSHELRAAYSSDALKLQVGAYYFDETSHVNFRINVGVNITPNGEAGATLLFDLNPTTATSYAFFGQGTYSLTDTLRVTGGIRYSHDNKTRSGIANFVCFNNFFNCAAPANQPLSDDANVNFSKVTYKGTIDFDAGPNTLLYATIATGYKAGGFNDGCVLGTGPNCSVPLDVFYFDPETLTSYEAGVKSRFLDNAVQVAATVFHYDYKNLQLTSIVSPCPATPQVPDSACGVVNSAAAAKIDGAEIEGTINPSPVDKFDFSVALLDARYADYQATPTVNFAGRSLDRSPDIVFTMGYQHIFELGGDYELVAGARTRVSDSYTFNSGTSVLRQPAFSKTDLNLTLNAPERRWYLQGFVKNLENTLSLNNTSFGGNFPFVSVADPRTYGVRAGFKF